MSHPVKSILYFHYSHATWNILGKASVPVILLSRETLEKHSCCDKGHQQSRVVKSTVCVQGQHNEFAHFGYPNIHRKGVIYLQDKYIYFWFISKLFRFRGLHPVLSLAKQLQESCLLLADCVNEKWKYWGFKTGSEFGRFVICTVKLT